MEGLHHACTADEAARTWPFEVVEVAGKGLGALASRKIFIGERIFKEAPLFILAPDSYTAEAAAAAVERLTEAGQQLFNGLCQDPSVYGPERQAIHVFHNNSLPLGPKSQGRGAGIFPTIARLNHSCIPNVSHCWNQALGVETVHAGRDIAAGEELLTCYIQPAQTRERRQAYLQAHFGFRCACAACALEGEALAASNARRSRVGWLEHQVTLCAQDYEQALGHVQEKVRLLEAEGLGDPCMLMQAELDAYQVCKLAGKHKEARKWLVKAAAHCMEAEGDDSPGFHRYQQLLNLPVKAPLSTCQNIGFSEDVSDPALEPPGV